MRPMYYRLKSEWAAAQAKAQWDALRELRRVPVAGGNYARRREQEANLTRLASMWEGRAARYRAQERIAA
jgi:hypothetical protein